MAENIVNDIISNVNGGILKNNASENEKDINTAPVSPIAASPIAATSADVTTNSNDALIPVKVNSAKGPIINSAGNATKNPELEIKTTTDVMDRIRRHSIDKHTKLNNRRKKGKIKRHRHPKTYAHHRKHKKHFNFDDNDGNSSHSGSWGSDQFHKLLEYLHISGPKPPSYLNNNVSNGQTREKLINPITVEDLKIHEPKFYNNIMPILNERPEDDSYTKQNEDDEIPTTVRVRFWIKKIRKIDVVASNVDLLFTVELKWKLHALDKALSKTKKKFGIKIKIIKQQNESDYSGFWVPSFRILNDEVLTAHKTNPIIDLDTREVIWRIQYSGTITNEIFLHPFPFDTDWFRILGGGNGPNKKHTVRLIDDGHKEECLAPWVDIQLPEWQVVESKAAFRFDSEQFEIFHGIQSYSNFISL